MKKGESSNQYDSQELQNLRKTRNSPVLTKTNFMSKRLTT